MKNISEIHSYIESQLILKKTKISQMPENPKQIASNTAKSAGKPVSPAKDAAKDALKAA